MSIIIELTTITAASTVVGAISSLIVALAQRKKIGQGDNLEIKIQKLTTALSDSAHQISNIHSEIIERQKLVEKLKADHEHYEKLVKLKESEVEAVAQLLRGELQKENKTTFMKSIMSNFIFFFLGSIVSLAIAYYTK